MRKIKILFFLFKRVEIVFKEPETSRMVIMDPDYSRDIVKNLREFNPFLLFNRTEQIKKIYLSKKIIFFILKNFFKRSLKINYLLKLILLVNPKILITRIDTSSDFHILSKILYKDIKCISLQQGLRFIYNNKLKHMLNEFGEKKELFNNNFKNYFIPEFFVFSKSDEVDFKLSKIKVKNFYIVGSIKASAALNYFKLNNIDTSLKYDFCLISDPDNFSITGHIASFLHDYCKEKNFKYVIAANSDLKDKKELQFFKQFVGTRKINIKKNNINKYSSYQMVLKSKIIIGQYSTLLKEALSYEKKVISINGLFNNFPNKDLFYCRKNKKNIWQSKNNSYLEFKNFVTQIHKMSKKKYFIKFKNNSDIMPKKLDTIKILKKEIVTFLKNY